MYKKILLILVVFLFCFKFSFGQNVFPKKLVGSWINVEYEKAFADSQYRIFEGIISPRFIYFDSLGNCTISTRFEHSSKIGKPIKSMKFGNAFQYSYRINKINFTVNEIEEQNNFICLNFEGFLIGIVFKKYK